MDYNDILMVDCHRHMGGSISIDCVWDIIRERKLYYLAKSIDDVREAMTFAPYEKPSFHKFLHKFKILDEIVWDEEAIDKSIKSVCDGLEQEEVDYCWIDFSINKYMHLQWHKSDAIQFIHSRFKEYRPNKVGLVLSLKYESLRESQIQYSKLIEDPNIADLLVGLDLVGDEEYFDPEFYAPIFKDWRNSGKMVRAHVGESQTGKNIEYAITRMGATNIAHGINIVKYKDIFQIANDYNITFDVALTSNYLTGVWYARYTHPMIDMIQQGLRVTLGSDDPIQCSTTLRKEFKFFREIANFHYSPSNIDNVVKQLMLNATSQVKSFII